MFFHSRVDKSKTRINKKHWLKIQYTLARIQLATIYPIKVNRAKACTVIDQIIRYIFELAWYIIEEKNGYVVAKLE